MRYETTYTAQGIVWNTRAKGRFATTALLLELDLGDIRPSVAGPKRPSDRIEVPNLKDQFAALFAESPRMKVATERSTGGNRCTLPSTRNWHDRYREGAYRWRAANRSPERVPRRSGRSRDRRLTREFGTETEMVG
jgi:aconitase A